MVRWALTGGCLVFLLAAAACAVWFEYRPGREPAGGAGAEPAGVGTARESDTDPPRLEETAAPPGLPIITWGPRDCFPVIRNPWFVGGRQGDTLLAADEPVLGLVHQGEARAYSTNQLNKHEMVLDEIAGTPILVTY